LANSKLPKDSLVIFNESNEDQLKKQQITIELLQKKVDELTMCLEKEKNLNNDTITKIPKVDEEVKENL
jgi:hypothetical protein